MILTLNYMEFCSSFVYIPSAARLILYCPYLFVSLLSFIYVSCMLALSISRDDWAPVEDMDPARLNAILREAKFYQVHPQSPYFPCSLSFMPLPIFSLLIYFHYIYFIFWCLADFSHLLFHFLPIDSRPMRSSGKCIASTEGKRA